ncbi:MAG: hypothetical protein KC419_04630, partial [Anaerolineales bacterium]|nr:hypothetical protein [Anaerolineales bacterium]
VPSLFFSTMVAAVFGDIFTEYQPMMFIIPAMTASLVSIVNVPLAAILFTVELYGTSYMVPALIMLVIASVFAHDHTIYRTQRERHDGRQIMPGVGSRRIRVPVSWVGQTLIDLDFRNQFDLNVIGLMEYRDESGIPRVRLNTSSTTPLEMGDVLVVLGRDEKLEVLDETVRRLSTPAEKPSDNPEPDIVPSGTDEEE